MTLKSYLLCLAGFLLSAYSFAETAADKSRPKAAQRIIVLAPHSVEQLYAIGAGDRIVATTEFSDYPEAAKAIPRIGGYSGLQIEKALALDPDLIIAWDGGNKAQDVDRLESLGLNVYRSKIKSIDHVGEELRVLGRMLGLEQKAEEVAADYERELATLREQNLAKPPVTFFYQLWLDPLKTMTGQSWVNETLRSCGGVNIFAGDSDIHYPQVSMESVLVKKPQAIVIPSHHGDAIVSGEHWSKWPEIPAVENKNIFYIDGDILHRASLRILHGVREVCTAFDQVRAHQAN